jgi:hypothetical protein
MIDIDYVACMVQSNPAAYDPVPINWGAGAVVARQNEPHSCCLCSLSASQAFVIKTTVGPRWLDTCLSCTKELYRAIR